MKKEFGELFKQKIKRFKQVLFGEQIEIIL